VLADRRRNLHERAAQAIEALFADRLEDHLSELAHHYDRGGNLRKAVEYLGRAGARAAQQVAHSEAAGYFTKALELLRRLPAGADRDRQEVELQMALGLSLFATRGAGAPEREPILTRAMEFCERLGDNAKLMEALLALGFFHQWQNEYGTVRRLAERVIALAEQARAPAMMARGHSQLGVPLEFTGYLVEARDHFERAIKLFESVPNVNSAGVHNYEMAGAADGLSSVLGWLGYPATALKRRKEALDAARRLSDPVLLASLLVRDAMQVMLHGIGDSQTAAERRQELFSIATEHGMAFRLIQTNFLGGWAIAAVGNGREGIAEMQRAMSDMKAFGWKSIGPLFVPLAEACRKSGLPEEGLAAVAEGLTRTDRLAEGALYQLKGELLLLRDPLKVSEAEACLRTSIEISRRQSAKWSELRATTSLARLLKSQGKTEEARRILSDIYNWFTEGFEFADLKNARVLLDELET
jgi:tetratricopeptide (TPR) repeat protein